MNDVVLSIDTAATGLPLDVQRFRSLSMPFVLQLGQELFSESPRLQHTDPERAKRLAVLITSKQPQVNAALFVAPAVACPPEEVTTRICNLGLEVMANLYSRQAKGVLTTVEADREVWRRLAA